MSLRCCVDFTCSNSLSRLFCSCSGCARPVAPFVPAGTHVSRGCIVFSFTFLITLVSHRWGVQQLVGIHFSSARGVPPAHPVAGARTLVCLLPCCTSLLLCSESKAEARLEAKTANRGRRHDDDTDTIWCRFVSFPPCASSRAIPGWAPSPQPPITSSTSSSSST